MDVIKAGGLTFSYPDGTKALDSVDFRAGKGEFVGMLASNGSGKTTLLKLLCGMLKPTSGTVELNGRPVGSIPPKEIFRMAGMVFQNPADQLFAATVAEDVAFGPTNMGLPKSEIDGRVAYALEAVGLKGLGSKPTQRLSFGQQKRACIAGLLAMGQELMLLDEPTAGLDPMGEYRIMELLMKLNREKGITMVMSTHNVDMVPLFIDRLYILSKGKVAREGSPAEVFNASSQLKGIKLRLPQIAELIEQMKDEDRVSFDRLPLTIGEARRELVKRMPGH
ncbi:MAG: ATP-binding cassette domain-containing protein [Nitrospirae bacterium]|nr:ATP-binding cassette domain-containing protein [Nitrospirota bacterium]